MKKTATIMITIMAVGILSFLPSFTGADTTISGKWFKMAGVIHTWNTTSGSVVPVFGWIGARGGIVDVNGTTHEWAMVHAIWSPEIVRINPIADPTENFTFSFYTARLIKMTDMNINLTENSFFVTGYWNVLNITTTFNITAAPRIRFTRTIEAVVTNATGELMVPSNASEPMSFSLAITGVGELDGKCLMKILSVGEIRMFSVTGDDSKVGLKDLVHVARLYGTTPGMRGYDLNADVDGDGKIDIFDLTTIAANIQG
jgi:hypothetical protein